MNLAKVLGRVVSTRKEESIEGLKLLMLGACGPDGQATGGDPHPVELAAEEPRRNHRRQSRAERTTVVAGNELGELEEVLLSGDNAIEVDPTIRIEAVKSIQRMLDFAASHNISGALPGR